MAQPTTLKTENIHVVRDSFKKLMLACSPQSSNIADEDAFLADVEASDWNKHLRSLIGGTVRVVNDVLAGRGVLVHCSDGTFCVFFCLFFFFFFLC